MAESVQQQAPVKDVPQQQLAPEDVAPASKVSTEQPMPPSDLPDLRRRLDPVVPGASIGTPDSTAATLGMIVEDNYTGRPMLLTVGHVLGAPAVRKDQADVDWEVGTPVLQPGPSDGGGLADRIGEVARVVLNDECDAGVAFLTGERDYTDSLPDGSRITGVTVPRLGMRVKRFGRSGLREATITQIKVTAAVGYQKASRTLTNLFMTEAMSTGGEAGSIVLEADTNRAVGMIFAGSDAVTLCIPIDTVMRALDIAFAGGEPETIVEERALDELIAVNDTVGVRAPDRLGYETYIESFVRLIRDPETKPPLTIGIYGAWGSGKTFLMMRIMERLQDLLPEDESEPEVIVIGAPLLSRLRARFRRREEPDEKKWSDVAVVHFNAWEYQASEAMWAGLVQKIFATVEVHLGVYGHLWISFRRNLKREVATLRRKLLPYTLIGGTVLTALIIALLALDQEPLALFVPLLGLPGLIRLGVDMLGILRQPQSEWIITFFAQPDYSKQMGFMADIRRDLEALVEGLPANMKIAVFVDDLDRCAPGKAVEVLEAIKLLLDFDRFIVCLGIDARIITYAIEDHYGDTFARAGVTGYEYLQKIVQIPFNIPEPSYDDVRKYLNSLLGAAEEETDTLEFPEPVFTVSVEPEAPAQPAEIESDAIAVDAPTVLETQAASEEEGRPFEVVVQKDVAFVKKERDAFRTFIPYMIPNPRRIKRLVNVYRLVRDLAPDKGLDSIVRQYDRLFPWLLMNEQAPFSTHVMLDCFENDRAGKYHNLAALYTDAKALLEQLGESRLHHLDADVHLVESLVRDFGARISRQDIDLLRTLTINFNPALRSEVHAALAKVAGSEKRGKSDAA